MHLPLGLRRDAARQLPDTRPLPSRGLPAATVVLALVIAAIGALVAGFEIAFAGEVLPGVHVDGVDLSGMRPEPAAAALAARLPADGKQVTIELPDGRTVSLAPAALGRTVDLAATVRAAENVGRSGEPFEAGTATLRALTSGIEVAPVVRVDTPQVARAVGALAASWDRPARDPAITTVAGRFAVVRGSSGLVLDQPALTQDLAHTLAQYPLPPALSVAARADPVAETASDDQAQAAAGAANRMAQPLTVIAAAPGLDRSTQLSAATIHGWIRFVPDPRQGIRAVADQGAIRATVATFARGMDQAVRPASLVLNGNDRVTVSSSLDGRAVDVDAGVRAIAAVLDDRAAGRAVSGPVALRVQVTAAPANTAQLASIAQRMTVVSSWTTYYNPTSDLNGFGANIRVPTTYIDGSEVAPGATFDIWQAIGPVTPARGFRRGGVIVNGHSQEQGALGGGLCSVSTTLFNAVLRAGYQIVDRTPHFYYIDRYPLGLDATIFHNADGSGVTMRFRNDTPYPLFIRGVNGPNFVRFSIITVPLGRQVSFSTPIVKNVSRGSTTYQPTSSLPKGTTKQVEWQADGMDVWVTRTVTDAGGAVVHRETYQSHYARMVGLILVGTG